MLCAYCSILDPNIDNINAQPPTLMNQVKARLEDKWEYIGYDLSYNEFKTHVNVFTITIHIFFIGFFSKKIPKNERQKTHPINLDKSFCTCPT
jgi:hypothetical protein